MSIWIDDIEIITIGKWIRYANIAPECYGSLEDPTAIIKKITGHGYNFDLVTFGQRLPDTAPRHKYYFEWEEIAALRLTTYDNWLNNQIIKENRKNISKASKKGITVHEAEFNDDLVNGIMEIYDECPIRQGKKFWHYKKDFDTVKLENGTYLNQSKFICAYYQDKLVGFVKIFLTEGCASTLQVISKIEHRDKKVSNALLAKTVEICASKHVQYLQYGVWSTGTLGQFKASNGFEKVLIPKYFVPLTLRGRAVLRLKVHHGLTRIVPPKLLEVMKGIRKRWYQEKYSSK